MKAHVLMLTKMVPYLHESFSACPRFYGIGRHGGDAISCKKFFYFNMYRLMAVQYPELLKLESNTGTPRAGEQYRNSSTRAVRQRSSPFWTLSSEKAAQVKDRKGRTALHLLFENRASNDMLAAVLDKYPTAARKMDAQGRTALHLALIGCSRTNSTSLGAHTRHSQQ